MNKNLIKNQFSKNAKTYDDFNVIQAKVIEKLMQFIINKPLNILDIGCGTGTLYKSINWELEKFVGLDFSQEMLDKHPNDSKTILLCKNFNNPESFEELKIYNFNRVVSSSSLQWADNLDSVFYNISKLNTPISFAIFTSGTFKTLHKVASINSPLRTEDEIKNLSEKYFDANFELLNYQLAFPSVRSMFQYIKKTGVSGGENKLNYKELRQLMKEYPLDYLEFEVLIINEE